MADTDQMSDAGLFNAAVAPEPAPEPAPAPVAEPPASTETPAPAPAPAAPTVEPEANVPSWRLREEAEARRLAEDRANQLDGRLREIEGHLRRANPAPKPNFFENPDEATRLAIMQAIGPYAEENRKTLMYYGKMIAGSVHGADKVDAAEKAFLEAHGRGTLDEADYERVVQSPNRYDAVVQWHKRQNVLSSVGDDPAAWFEKQLNERLADPKFQAQLLEKMKQGAAARPGAVVIPPSLSTRTAAAGNGADNIGDLSDKSLFSFATEGMSRR